MFGIFLILSKEREEGLGCTLSRNPSPFLLYCSVVVAEEEEG